MNIEHTTTFPSDPPSSILFWTAKASFCPYLLLPPTVFLHGYSPFFRARPIRLTPLFSFTVLDLSPFTVSFLHIFCTTFSFFAFTITSLDDRGSVRLPLWFDLMSYM